MITLYLDTVILAFVIDFFPTNLKCLGNKNKKRMKINMMKCSILRNKFKHILILITILHTNMIPLNGNELDLKNRNLNERNALLVDNVIAFCKTNGRKMLTFIPMSYRDGNVTMNGNKFLADFVSQTLKTKYNSSYARYFPSLTVARQTVKTGKTTDTFIFLLPLPELSNNELLSKLFEFISQSKVQSSIVLVIESEKTFQDVENEIITPVLQDLRLSTFFYLVRFSSGNLTDSNKIMWRQVITLKNNPQIVFDDVKLGKDGIIEEHYNLKGLNIHNLVLSWSPYSTIDECNEDGRDCRKEIGIIPDLVHSLSERFNFTWTSTKETTGSWGTLPEDGSPFDLEEGKWAGVMGGVVNGEYHASFAGWTWNLQREQILDLVMFQKEWTVLAVCPKPPKVDSQLFIRPFRNNAWYFIIGMMCLLITLLLLPYVLLRKGSTSWEDTQGFMITKTTGWIFFFLLNAFYGGAMTMFFASEVSLPFETVREAMQSYPGRFTPIDIV